MQRKPVPSALIRGERLAAPFPVHPCLTGDLYRSIVDGDAARRLEIRLAKIIRGLSALRFSAVAGLALQNECPIGVEAQRVTEIRTRGGEFERRDGVVARPSEPTHFPCINPGPKRLWLDAGLANAAAGKRFAVSVGIGTRHRGVTHPDLLVGPAFLLGARLHRLTKQRPLRAIGNARRIGKISGHVPPLDPVARMRTVIFREGKDLAGGDGCESFRFHAEAGKALGKRAFAAKPEKSSARDQCAAGYRHLIAHRQKS